MQYHNKSKFAHHLLLNINVLLRELKYLGVVNYVYKKYLGGELGGGSGGLDQSTMVLSAKQLVLIFFIGITNDNSFDFNL